MPSDTPRGYGQTTQMPLLSETLDVESLFWAVSDAVIIYDLQKQTVVEWNPAAVELFGYSREEALGLSLEAMLPERVRGEIMAVITDFIASKPVTFAGDDGKPVEFPALHKSGHELMVEYSSTPVGGPGSVYVMTIVRDCTERYRMEQERADLLARAQETANRAHELARLKDDFTAMVAHELVAPVASIRGIAELLERDGLPELQRDSMLAMIRSEAQVLQRLVDDIRDSARIERVEFGVRQDPVPVSTLLADAAGSAEVTLADHDFTVSTAPETSVYADRARIGQVLRNLLNNAAKYSPPATSVRLRAWEDGGMVCIEVADDGPGIEPDDLDRIFTKFGRGRDAEGRRLPGAGLGLYLSRRIVLAHGSDLTVESEPGKGTTFRFALQEARS